MHTKEVESNELRSKLARTHRHVSVRVPEFYSTSDVFLKEMPNLHTNTLTPLAAAGLSRRAGGTRR